MTTIKSFDRTSIRFLQVAVSDALKKVGEAFGVEFKLGGGRFSPTHYGGKLDVTIAGAEPQEAQDFRRYADMFGLKPDDLGRTFLSRGRQFTIVGLLARSKRYPVLGQNGRGTRYKFPVETVKAGLSTRT